MADTLEHPQVLDVLACPVCQGKLRRAAEGILCGGCGRRYPVVDGIPVLIAGRAESSAESGKS